MTQWHVWHVWSSSENCSSDTGGWTLYVTLALDQFQLQLSWTWLAQSLFVSSSLGVGQGSGEHGLEWSVADNDVT